MPPIGSDVLSDTVTEVEIPEIVVPTTLVDGRDTVTLVVGRDTVTLVVGRDTVTLVDGRDTVTLVVGKSIEVAATNWTVC